MCINLAIHLLTAHKLWIEAPSSFDTEGLFFVCLKVNRLTISSLFGYGPPPWLPFKVTAGGERAEGVMFGGKRKKGEKKKKKETRHHQLPPFLSSGTMRRKLCLHCFCLSCLPFSPSRSSSAVPSDSQPEWVTGFTSVGCWPRLPPSPLLPSGLCDSLYQRQLRRNDMEVLWVRSGKSPWELFAIFWRLKAFVK